MGRIALIIGSVLILSATARAQREIEMDGDPPEQQAAPDPAQQPPAVKDPKVAKKWQQAGDKLMQKGDQLTKAGKPDAKTQYENAVTAYQRAIEASDDMTLLYPLALAFDKSGDTPEAMKQLKRLLATPIKPELAKKSQAKLDELSMKVGIVTFMITPDGTQVSVAGKPIGDAPLTEPIVLMPGSHKVSFTAGGFLPKDVEVKVEAGSESERKIALELAPVVAKVHEPEEPAVAAHSPAKTPSKRPLYVGGGTAIGLTLIATVTGMIAVGKHGTFTDPSASPTERADAQSSGRAYAHVTDFCLLGALGAASFTAYWYVYKVNRKQIQASDETAKVDVVPWVQPQSGGLAVAGSF